MKIGEPVASRIVAAIQGDLAALDEVLLAIQGGVYNLAVRMLGNREDAADATQEILLKVVTHLASFRAEARFSTWVYAIARYHLLNALTRSREAPALSLTEIGEHLHEGLDFAAHQGNSTGEHALTPEDKAIARQTALACTQGMLMALDREHRLAYVLDILIGLDSNEAAEVCGITAEAHRQRLTRARTRLDSFFNSVCGLANEAAPCRCERQLPALRAQALADSGTVRDRPAAKPRTVASITSAEHAQAQRQLEALERLGNAAAVLRAHPDYAAPQVQLAAIRSVLQAEGFLSPAASKGPH